MIYNVKIHQMKIEANNKFMPYDFTMKHGGINLADYEMIYEMRMMNNYGVERNLDIVYEKLNLYHPSDYKGHSLSVSDIIEINGDMYYVDSIGFKRI